MSSSWVVPVLTLVLGFVLSEVRQFIEGRRDRTRQREGHQRRVLREIKAGLIKSVLPEHEPEWAVDWATLDVEEHRYEERLIRLRAWRLEVEDAELGRLLDRYLNALVESDIERDNIDPAEMIRQTLPPYWAQEPSAVDAAHTRALDRVGYLLRQLGL